ncbi:MAG: pyruvate kinase [Spirochaetaceae bacterium]
MSLTKIVCTMGPAVESPERIRALLDAGMTTARLNFSHGTAEGKRKIAGELRRIAKEEQKNLAIMGDLQGPKIRIGKLPEEGVFLEKGEEILISAEATEFEARRDSPVIPFPHPEIVKTVANGASLLLDDGNLELEVIESAPPLLRCRVIIGGVLTSNKGVNLPGVELDISALTEKDKIDAALAVELGLDYLALSFVRSSKDIEELKRCLVDISRDIGEDGGALAERERTPGENPHGLPSIVAKIEKPEALDDLEGIVLAADAVMVARGDLGVEISPEQVPMAQKRIIRWANKIGKPVITATQMLQSMIDSPRPTRAEASDVANAILDGSDAVMLSGETSVGSYPVEATAFMEKIARQMEESAAFPYNQLMDIEDLHRGEFQSGESQADEAMISEAVSRVTVDISEQCLAAAIITSTESGRTARTVARHRPRCPLLVVTPFEETARRMQLIWGVHPFVVEPFATTDKMIGMMVRSSADAGFAGVGDRIVLTAGIPFEVHGVTNMLKVHTIRREEVDTVPGLSGQ